MSQGSVIPDAERLMSALLEQRGRFLAFVTSRVRTSAEAEDILQAAFARALERADSLSDAEAVHGWFFQILRNAIVDHGRRESARYRAHEGLSREIRTLAPALERTARVCQCVNRLRASLKPEYAEILQEVAIDGTSVRAFAEQRGISASAAGVRIFRARSALLERVHSACGTCAAEGCDDCTCASPPRSSSCD